MAARRLFFRAIVRWPRPDPGSVQPCSYALRPVFTIDDVTLSIIPHRELTAV